MKTWHNKFGDFEFVLQLDWEYPTAYGFLELNIKNSVLNISEQIGVTCSDLDLYSKPEEDLIPDMMPLAVNFCLYRIDRINYDVPGSVYNNVGLMLQPIQKELQEYFDGAEDSFNASFRCTQKLVF